MLGLTLEGRRSQLSGNYAWGRGQSTVAPAWEGPQDADADVVGVGWEGSGWPGEKQDFSLSALSFASPAQWTALQPAVDTWAHRAGALPRAAHTLWGGGSQ